MDDIIKTTQQKQDTKNEEYLKTMGLEMPEFLEPEIHDADSEDPDAMTFTIQTAPKKLRVAKDKQDDKKRVPVGRRFRRAIYRKGLTHPPPQGFVPGSMQAPQLFVPQIQPIQPIVQTVQPQLNPLPKYVPPAIQIGGGYKTYKKKIIPAKQIKKYVPQKILQMPKKAMPKKAMPYISSDDDSA